MYLHNSCMLNLTDTPLLKQNRLLWVTVFEHSKNRYNVLSLAFFLFNSAKRLRGFISINLEAAIDSENGSLFEKNFLIRITYSVLMPQRFAISEVVWAPKFYIMWFPPNWSNCLLRVKIAAICFPSSSTPLKQLPFRNNCHLSALPACCWTQLL